MVINTPRKIHVSIISRYRGVSWHKQAFKWQSRISVNGKQIFLGLFDSEMAAARAYDKAVYEHFGESIRCNFRNKKRPI